MYEESYPGAHGYNFGPQKGVVVTPKTSRSGGSSQGPTEDARATEVLGPNTEAGQAIMVALIGFGLLWVAVGKTEGGAIARAGAVLQAVALVAAAMWIVGFSTRLYVARHPDGPLAMGFAFDS